MNSHELNANDAMDAPTAAMSADGPVTIDGAVWTDATPELHELQRRGDELRRLFGDAAREV